MSKYIFFLCFFVNFCFADDLAMQEISLGEKNSRVSFVFEGVLNTKGQAKKLNSDVKDKYSQAIYQIINVNSYGNAEDILKLWLLDERGKISELIKNEKQFENNVAFFKNIIATKVIAVVKYNGHYIVYVDHKLKGIDSYIKAYPLFDSNGSLLLSNKISNDMFFTKIGGEVISYYWNGK